MVRIEKIDGVPALAARAVYTNRIINALLSVITFEQMVALRENDAFKGLHVEFFNEADNHRFAINGPTSAPPMRSVTQKPNLRLVEQSAPVPAKADPDDGMVAALKHLLQCVEAGEVTWFYGAGIARSGVMTVRAGSHDNAFECMGALHHLSRLLDGEMKTG